MAHFTHGREYAENILRGIIKWMDDTAIIGNGDDRADAVVKEVKEWIKCRFLLCSLIFPSLLVH